MKMNGKEKMKKEKIRDFSPTKKGQPVFGFFKKILFRPIYGVRLESSLEELPDKAIIASVHAAKSGPMAITVSYPKKCAMWGHHGMLGGYKERFLYLRNVLYIQKMHKGKFISTLKSLVEAAFSIFIYKGMNVLGTYTDMRLLGTVKRSMEVLDNGMSVIIFPEDSSEGYFDEICSAFPGFVMLASLYYKKRGEDVPVIPTYVTTKERRLILGQPRYVHEMELSGMKAEEIAEVIKEDINSLYRDYVATGKAKEVTAKSAEVRTRGYYGEEEIARDT